MSNRPIRFGTDGWRAAIAQDFTFDAVRRLSHGLAQYVKDDSSRENHVVVGYDRRFASEHFARAAAETLAGNGLVVDLSDRAMPTQICSLLARDLGCMSLVVTASHNEWLDNGIKIKDSTGAPAEEDVLRAIEDRVPVEPPELNGRGQITVSDLTQRYGEKVRNLVDIESICRLSIDLVVDVIHGCGVGWLDELLPRRRSLKIREMRSERNPYFGGVNPEPIPPHIDALCETVVKSGAGGGLAFDGDADRVGLVTETGRFVNQLQVYGLLYWHLLADRGLRKPAVYTVTTTQMVPRLAHAFGTDAYETPVGFKYVGPKMLEVGAVIGGEESGGYGFGFHIPERDGLLAALLLLEMRAQRGVSFDELLNSLQREFGPSEYSRIDVRFERDGYEQVVERTMADVEKSIETVLVDETISKLDRLGNNGFKIYFADGSWLLLRFSGTEPALRIYAEGSSELRVTELLKEGRALAS